MAVEETAQEIAVTTADSPFGNGYFIRIEKKGIVGMGIAISMLNNIGFGGWTSGGLKVDQINRGLIHEWNLSNPSMQVLENDIIVEVNSVRGDINGLLEKIANESVLELRLLRPYGFEYDFGTQVKLTPGSFPPLTHRAKTYANRQRSIFGIV